MTRPCGCHENDYAAHRRDCSEHYLNREPREPKPGDPSPGLAAHVAACSDVERRAYEDRRRGMT